MEKKEEAKLKEEEKKEEAKLKLKEGEKEAKLKKYKSLSPASIPALQAAACLEFQRMKDSLAHPPI